jgi:rubrerythrin
MKTYIHSDYRLEIEPNAPLSMQDKNGGEKHIAWTNALDALKRDVERHVDGVENVRELYETEAVCSFCGWPWDDDNDVAPDCCDAANREWQQEAKP